MAKLRILLVEDEVIIAEDINLRLTNMGFKVLHTIDTVESAEQWLIRNSVDLIIIDIALNGDKNGIDLAETINKKFNIPFIYLTSLCDDSIIEKAKKTCPAAYLFKPFNDKQIQVSIEVAFENFYSLHNDKKQTKEVSQKEGLSVTMSDALFLKKDNQYIKEYFVDILWLEAESNYTLIKTKSSKYLYSTVLKNFEDRLPENLFARVHRSFIVNLSCVSGLDGNMLIVEDKRIPTNKSFRETVLKRFNLV